MRWELLQDQVPCERLCTTLGHSIWLVALIAIIAWIVDRLVGRRVVERSYAIHVAALVVSVMALPVTFWSVQIRGPVPPADVSTVVPVVQQPLTASLPVPTRTDVGSVETPLATAATNSSEPHVLAGTVQPKNADGPRLSALVAPWLAGLYLAGVAVMLVRLARGIWRTQRQGVEAEVLREGPLVDILHSLARQWSMRIVPVLASTERTIAPKVIGLVRPTILLPASAISGLSTDELELILTHELAHIRRRDMWVSLVQRLAEVVLFFNPAMWYLNRRISLLREYCCDEAVCGSTIDANREPHIRYAQALLRAIEVGGIAHDSPELTSLAAAGRSPSELRRRIARLLGEPLAESIHLSRASIAAVALMALALLAGPAAWHSVAETPIQTASERTDAAAQEAESECNDRTPDSDLHGKPHSYPVDKKVSEFPATDDFSTPEAAYATINRKQAAGPLDWRAVSCRRVNADLPAGKEFRTPRPTEEVRKRILDARILEVRTLGNFAQVAARWEGKTPPIDLRCFEFEDGRWLNGGNDRVETLEEAAAEFERLVKWRQGRTQIQAPAKATPKAKAKIPFAPEQLELMGRVEWVMMHNFRDLTARKTIEWGDVEKHENGNRSIRYKYQATIWDRDRMIVNQVFAFDSEGNLVSIEHVEGFPRKVEPKKVDTTSKEGMIALVEDFFCRNFRDITRRDDVKWGGVSKDDEGNSSIRCTYEATIWDKDKKKMDQVFTFTPDGKFVSVSTPE